MNFNEICRAVTFYNACIVTENNSCTRLLNKGTGASL